MSTVRRRQLHWSQIRIGVVVSLTAVLAALSIFFIDELAAAFESRYTLHFHTLTTQALRAQAPVWLAGQRVGHVESLSFEPATRERTERLRVTLRVTTDVRALITRGAVAQVTNSGLLGEAVVNIVPATEAGAPLDEFDELPAAKELDPDRVVERLRSLMDTLAPVAERWAEVTRQARDGDGTLARLARDPGTLSEWQAHLDEVSATFYAVGSLARGIGDAVSGGEGRAPLDRISTRFEELARRWDEGGGSAGALARDTILAGRLHRITARAEEIRNRLESGRGSAGRFLHDSALARELAETRAMLRTLREDLRTTLGERGPPP